MESTQNDNNGKRVKTLLIALITITIIAILVLVAVFFVRNLKKATPPQAGITIPSGATVPNNPPTGSSVTGGEGETNAGSLIPEKQVLAKLWDGAVGGYTVMGSASDTKIRLFDRAQGIFAEVDPKTGEKTVLADKALVGMYDAYFLAGERVIVRALDSKNIVHAFLYRLVSSDGGKPYVVGDPVSLADNIREIGVSPDMKKAVLVVDNGADASIDLLDAPSEQVSEIAKLPLTEWLPHVGNDGKVILVAKTSEDYSSGAYLLDKGHLRMIIPGSPAQSAVINESGDTALVSSKSGDGFATGLRSLKNISAEEGNVPFATIADKCAFAGVHVFCGVPAEIPTSGFPDVWYLGIASTHDALYSYDPTSDTNVLVVSPWKELKINIDMIDMKTDDAMIYFIDKNSGALYRALSEGSGSGDSSNGD